MAIFDNDIRVLMFTDLTFQGTPHMTKPLNTKATFYKNKRNYRNYITFVYYEQLLPSSQQIYRITSYTYNILSF